MQPVAIYRNRLPFPFADGVLGNGEKICAMLVQRETLAAPALRKVYHTKVQLSKIAFAC
ncbi:hypothetical protein GBAG_2108 [Buttiauxella agrestis ATCC 33320]|uniref:Uncharacterized protein n=1 Tax=Buttiauxella agrestis ATCC 33320 TaxID=1006004 RepID=A0A085GC83_9ENTR|nr:hypothetical protein GBAG_2108 [Buttiauxella agrestis ATCC 33320]